MKQIILKYILIFFSLIPISLNSSTIDGRNSNNDVTIIKIGKEYKNYFKNTYEVNYALLTNNIGFKESSNNYKCINNIGCIGKYQFKTSTLRDYNYNISVKAFRANPEIFSKSKQDLVMVTHLKHMHILLDNTIKKYAGKTICGQTMTANKIIAGAHFAGVYGMKQFLKSKKNKSDGNTTISEYIKNI